MSDRLRAECRPSWIPGALRAGRALGLCLCATAAVPAAHAGLAARASLDGNAFVNDRGQVVLNGYGQPEESGAAWQRAYVSLATSFRVTFSYAIETDRLPGGNGLAFVIQSEGAHALGPSGDGIGFQGLQGVASIVHTTFDQLGFSLSSDPISAPAAPASFADAYSTTGKEVVSYDAVAHKLSMQGTVTIGDVTYPVSDERDVDLAQLLGSDVAWLGFTGAESDLVSRNRITGYQFQTRP